MDNGTTIQTPTSFNQQAIQSPNNQNGKYASLKVIAILISVILVVVAIIATIILLTPQNKPEEQPKPVEEEYNPFTSGRKIFEDNEELDKDLGEKYDSLTKFYLELNNDMPYTQLKTLAESYGFSEVAAYGDTGIISIGEQVYIKFNIDEQDGKQTASKYTLNREMNGADVVRYVAPIDDGKYEYYNGVDYTTYSNRKRAVNAFILDLEEAPIEDTNFGSVPDDPEGEEWLPLAFLF